MTLNGVMALILRYFTEFGSFPSALRKSGWRCRRKKSRSLSHLLMSFLYDHQGLYLRMFFFSFLIQSKHFFLTSANWHSRNFLHDVVLAKIENLQFSENALKFNEEQNTNFANFWTNRRHFTTRSNIDNRKQQSVNHYDSNRCFDGWRRGTYQRQYISLAVTSGHCFVCPRPTVH